MKQVHMRRASEIFNVSLVTSGPFWHIPIMSIPEREECFQLLKQYHVPTHIVEHSVMVGRVAVALCRMLLQVPSQGAVAVEIRLAEPGGLLHDIAKMECIEKQCEHASRGANILLSHGYPELADMVRQHVVLDRPVSAYQCITDAMVLNYADKRVMHTEFVSLEDRFEDLQERYGTTPERKERIDFMYSETKKMEQMIFDVAGTDPQHLQPAPLHEMVLRT